MLFGNWAMGMLVETRDRRIFETVTDNDSFKKIFTDFWPVADILLNTDTDISKFASDILRYFNKAFWLKLVRIAYTSLVHFISNNTNQFKCVYVTAKIAMQYYRQDMKNFVQQILIKFEEFYVPVIKMNLVQTVLSKSTPKYW